jgi:hypothetical protein
VYRLYPRKMRRSYRLHPVEGTCSRTSVVEEISFLRYLSHRLKGEDVDDGRTIRMVKDDPGVNKTFTQILRKSGYRLANALDAESGWREMPRGTRPGP